MLCSAVLQVDASGTVIGGLLGDKSPTKCTAKDSATASTPADKVTAAGAAVASGYELTVGTVSGTFCNTMVAPHLSGSDKICLSQVSVLASIMPMRDLT